MFLYYPLSNHETLALWFGRICDTEDLTLYTYMSAAHPGGKFFISSICPASSGELSQCHHEKLFDSLLDVSGKVQIEDRKIIVTLDKRTHNPYLVDPGLADQPTPMPWLEGKELVVQFA